MFKKIRKIIADQWYFKLFFNFFSEFLRDLKQRLNLKKIINRNIVWEHNHKTKIFLINDILNMNKKILRIVLYYNNL